MIGKVISIAVVDSGPLLAVANLAGPDHKACLDILSDRGHRLVIPALCVAEVCYLLGRKKGPTVEASCDECYSAGAAIGVTVTKRPF